jgi:hypothetical protein
MHLTKVLLRTEEIMPNLSTRFHQFFGCTSKVGRIFGLCFVLLAVTLLTACTTNRDSIAAGLPSPDTGFYTGTVAGYNVFIWECYQGKRIVIFKTSAEMTSSDYERQESPCGETTAIEKQLETEQKRDLDPKEFWR